MQLSAEEILNLARGYGRQDRNHELFISGLLWNHFEFHSDLGVIRRVKQPRNSISLVTIYGFE